MFALIAFHYIIHVYAIQLFKKNQVEIGLYFQFDLKDINYSYVCFNIWLCNSAVFKKLVWNSKILLSVLLNQADDDWQRRMINQNGNSFRAHTCQLMFWIDLLVWEIMRHYVVGTESKQHNRYSNNIEL